MPTHFQYRAYSDHPHIKQQAGFLVAEMVAGMQRKPGEKAYKEYLRCMTIALAGLQLAGAYQQEDIQIPLDRNHYRGQTRRSPLHQPKLLTCFEWLIQHEYLVKTQNHSYNEITQAGHPAAYQLTKKWLMMAAQFPPPPPASIVRDPAAPYVIVRDDKKQPVYIEPHPLFQQWTQLLEDYDKALRHHSFSFQGDEQALALFSLTRIFNGSWERGGRFYAAFQQWPAIDRHQLTIDIKETVEVDYKTFHPSLLYQRIEAVCPIEAYDVEGYDRETVKTAFNMMVSSTKDGGEFWRDFCGKFRMKKEPAQVLERGIRSLHRPIEHFFGTGIGLELQRYDSTICEAVLAYMVQRENTIVLPIHDSFVIKVEDLPILAEALTFAEGYAAKEHGLVPRATTTIYLDSEGLRNEVFSLDELLSAFPGEEVTVSGDRELQDDENPEDEWL